MLILSLDSAGAGCSVAVWQDGKVLAEKTEMMERGQDRRLMPLVLEVMDEAEITFDNLDRIAVTRGPGSFTGLRIGLAAARGVGLASGKPVIGIDRFSIFRAQVSEPGKNLFVVINSKRDELYCRFYPAQGDAAEPVMLTKAQIENFLRDKPETIIAGDNEKPAISEAVTAAALTAKAIIGDTTFLPRPLYLRAPDVSTPSIVPNEANSR